MTKLSVIIPTASWDESWIDLADDLAILPAGTEIILVLPHDDGEPELARVKSKLQGKKIITVKSVTGMAKSLNAGAKSASGDYLWFLSSNSRFSKESFAALERDIAAYPDALHYFTLKFINDGPRLVFLNEIGSKIRSILLQVPFGDQGFCLKKEIFNKIGGYNETVEAGEDQLLVWQAKKNGIKINYTNAPLLTSARKYDDMGWMHQTLTNQCLWIKPAIPGFSKMADELFKKHNISDKAKNLLLKAKLFKLKRK